MSALLDELVQLLTLEQIEAGLFRGQSQDLGLPQVFGGQVIGQALAAAQQTVALDRAVHSFHCYFLRPGDVHKGIVYDVEVIRDGRSYATRRVKAVQHGRAIFYMTASFHGSESGCEHQLPMPEVAGPEHYPSEQQLARQFADRLPAPIRDKYLQQMPIEFRLATPFNTLDPKPCPPLRHVWLRADGRLGDDLNIHRYLLAYASDFHFLPTATQPHGLSFMQPQVQMASIDHAMWFHRPLRCDDWLLYQVESTTASAGRALVRGQFFNRQGQLVASTMQEGVFRVRQPAAAANAAPTA